MIKKQYDFIVYIGRFQPFHNGHQEVVNNALEIADRVVVLVGSSHGPRTTRNPFTYEQRKNMIQGCFLNAERITIVPLPCVPYDDVTWFESVHKIVNGVVAQTFEYVLREPKIALIGHEKDATSYYLKGFPSWERVDFEHHEKLNATDIRNCFFTRGIVLDKDVPAHVANVLAEYRDELRLQMLNMQNKFQNIENYKKQWANTPYPPTFTTADAVVIHFGKVLLVTRKDEPGKGLLALPGGFVNQDETCLQAAKRELFEETGVEFGTPHSALGVFDMPSRSERGRVITTAFLFNLMFPPDLKPGDDAADAGWFQLDDLTAENMFDDHFFIIRELLKGNYHGK
jgi:bifunctional NMN adenylyltransferase/nudix hydrolase